MKTAPALRTAPEDSSTAGHAPPDVRGFQHLILEHYRRNGRRLPWRATRDPYHILVSEVMLQQTQVERVVEKYAAFTEKFPDVRALAQAHLRSVLSAWQGLGYNRRAKALKSCAEIIVSRCQGVMPRSYEALLELPGIGPATAAAICVFAYNQPRIFIETNIRSVYIHFFFPNRHAVRDQEVLPVVAETLYRTNPRRWYNALMDYGVMLKKLHANPGRKSAQYVRQSPFKNSNRQIRGLIIKKLVDALRCTEDALVQAAGGDTPRVKAMLSKLQAEGFIQKRGRLYRLG